MPYPLEYSLKRGVIASFSQMLNLCIERNIPTCSFCCGKRASLWSHQMLFCTRGAYKPGPECGFYLLRALCFMRDRFKPVPRGLGEIRFISGLVHGGSPRAAPS